MEIEEKRNSEKQASRNNEANEVKMWKPQDLCMENKSLVL